MAAKSLPVWNVAAHQLELFPVKRDKLRKVSNLILLVLNERDKWRTLAENSSVYPRRQTKATTIMNSVYPETRSQQLGSRNANEQGKIVKVSHSSKACGSGQST